MNNITQEQLTKIVQLHGAWLRGADMGDADMGDASLRDANMGGAELVGANLVGANKRRREAPIQPDKSRRLCGILPDGGRSEVDGGRKTTKGGRTMNKQILFRDEFLHQIGDGRKTQTRRPRKTDECPYGRIGDLLDVNDNKGNSVGAYVEIISVRAEQLQDISEADAMAEGCDGSCPIGYIPAHQAAPCGYHFAQLWNSIYGNTDYAWTANPWVWAIEFRRVEA